MSVTFTAHQEPTGYTLSCSFYDTVHATAAEANEAAKAHAARGGRGPCQHLLDWEAQFDGDWDARSGAYDEFVELSGTYPDFCERGAGVSPVYAEEAPAINMSNANALPLLEMLGFGADAWVGSVAAADFLGRVLVADALNAGDPGVPSFEAAGANGARVLHSGRTEGYYDDKLVQLRSLAEWANERNMAVSWS